MRGRAAAEADLSFAHGFVSFWQGPGVQNFCGGLVEMQIHASS